MADNYLERRMEELRSGKLAIKSGIPGINPRGMRIIVAGGTSGEAYDKVLEYRGKGYRVAVFDADETIGRKMAYENGIRFHHVDLTDEKALAKETENLLKAWRGFDIIVGDENTCLTINKVMLKWQQSLPIPDLSKVKFVIL